MASFPDKRMTEMAPMPGAVARATMVSAIEEVKSSFMLWLNDEVCHRMKYKRLSKLMKAFCINGKF
jgi:hypothetical protein